MAGKRGIVFSRFRHGLALLRRASPFKFVIGRDIRLNTDTLIAFIRQRYG
jgi:hypothetical protein